MIRKETKNRNVAEEQEDLQADLTKLQRQLRLLQDDRNCYKEEAENTLRKQNEAIASLQAEHGELAKDFKIVSSRTNRTWDLSNTETLLTLLSEEGCANEHLKERKKILDDVNKSIKELTRKLDKLRSDMGGCKESESKCKSMGKQNRVMENRLNEANVKFNRGLARNKKMRQEIGHINLQRQRFNDLLKKLKRVFNRGKEKKDFLIESSTAQFNNRDEAQHRMQCLRERSERDMTQFNAELKDLLRIIDHDKKLQEFMSTKMEERSEAYEAVIRARTEKKLLAQIDFLQHNVENYENILKQLVEVSGTEDVDEMVNNFIRTEDENFASFNFVKEQTRSFQACENEMNAIHEQIKSSTERKTVVEKQHKKILSKLEQRDHFIDMELKETNSAYKNDIEKLDAVLPLIDRFFAKIGCNRDAVSHMLGGSKITHSNLSLYLGMIEERGMELMQARNVLILKLNPEEPHKPITFSSIGRAIRALITPAFKVADIPDIMLAPGEDATVRPMSQGELRAQALVLARAAIAAQQQKQTLR